MIGVNENVRSGVKISGRPVHHFVKMCKVCKESVHYVDGMLIGCGSYEDEKWECWLGDENLLKYLIRELGGFI